MAELTKGLKQSRFIGFPIEYIKASLPLPCQPWFPWQPCQKVLEHAAVAPKNIGRTSGKPSHCYCYVDEILSHILSVN